MTWSKPNPRYNREARAELTDVTDRIAAADNETTPSVTAPAADRPPTGQLSGELEVLDSTRSAIAGAHI